jgi:hypothetical protein
MNNCMKQHQTYHIDHDVALLAFDLFASTIAAWINSDPLFFRALHALAVDIRQPLPPASGSATTSPMSASHRF